MGTHLVFADATDSDARAVLADALEQLGFGAENGTWRNAYLAGATELRSGTFGTPTTATAPDMLTAMTVEQVLDGVGIRIDGPRAWDERIQLAFVITDEGRTHLAELRNGALHHRVVERVPAGTTTVRLTRLVLIDAVAGTLDIAAAAKDGTIGVQGDPGALARLVELLAPVDPDFAIVTP